MAGALVRDCTGDFAAGIVAIFKVHQWGQLALGDTESQVRAAHAQIKGGEWGEKDFVLDATVGTGTFGRVHVARIRGSRNKTAMALKIMKKSRILKMKQVEHIMAEAGILAQIQHPFIVNMLTSFQDERRLFLLLEFVNGGELFSHMRSKGRLPEEEARFYAGEVVLAFSHLHSKHIAYRDLKPENILIDCEGHLKLTDFGFAKVVKDRTWTVCGTPEYLAPEIIKSKGHGLAVDWWAMGILVFEMRAGYPPFYDERPLGIYRKVLAGNIEFPVRFGVHARDLVTRLLVPDCAKRLGSFKDGAKDVQEHKWFASVDWNALLDRRVAAKFIPPVRAQDDTSMFDAYPDEEEGSEGEISPGEQELFEGF